MQKTKYSEITLLNAVLCLCVIMIHLTSEPVMQLEYGSFWHILIFIINKSLCFSVPAFLFLSGFKLYNKYEDEKIDLKRFWLGRFTKIVIPYIAAVLVYFIYFFAKKWVSPADLPQYIFLGTLASQFYYIVVAVQFYLLFPVLKLLVSRFPTLTLTASLICTVLIQQLFNFRYYDRFAGTYVFYFVLGMLFAKYRIHEKSGRLCVIGICGTVLTAAVHLPLIYMSIYLGRLTYICDDIVNIIYITFAIFALYGIAVKLRGKFGGLHKCARVLGNVSFSVYLYHVLLIFLLKYDILPRFDLSVRERFIISFVVVYALTAVYAAVSTKLKKKFRNK